NLEPALALLGDVLARPRLEPDEHARLVRESLAALDDELDDDSTLCARFHTRLVLPRHPYGRHPIGTRASLRALGAADARAWVDRHVVRPNLIVGLAGDVEPARAEALATGVFAAVPDRPAPAAPTFPAPSFSEARRTGLIDKPERVQSQILLGHPAPPS